MPEFLNGNHISLILDSRLGSSLRRMIRIRLTPRPTHAAWRGVPRALVCFVLTLCMLIYL